MRVSSSYQPVLDGRTRSTTASTPSLRELGSLRKSQTPARCLILNFQIGVQLGIKKRIDACFFGY